MFDLRYLLDFLDIARTGNYSASARNRNISQPALTRRMQQVEDWAGRRLFDRTTTPLTLTPAGAEFVPIATRIVAELDDFRKSGKPVERAPLRCMSIHALGNWLRDHAAAAVPAISFGTYDQCFTALRDNAADIALVYRSEKVQDARFKGLVHQPVGTDMFVPVASAHYLEGNAAGGTVVELARDNYLGQALAAAFERCKSRPGYKDGPCAARIDAVRGYVEAGCGIGWLPASMVQGDLDAGRLRQVRDADLEVGLDVVLIGTSDEKVSAGAHFFVPVSHSHSLRTPLSV